LSESAIGSTKRIDYKAEIAAQLAELDSIDARIVQHQAEYERSRAESKVVEARIDANLHELRKIVELLSAMRPITRFTSCDGSSKTT
jgi:hypothetical protein